MSKFKVNGKSVVEVSKNGDGVIDLFKLEDGNVVLYQEMVSFIEEGKTEGLMVHEGRDDRKIVSAKRGDSDDIENSLDDLPVFNNRTGAPEDILITGKRVVAIREDEDGNITNFKLEDGTVLDYSGALDLIRRNHSNGLNIHEGRGGRPIISAVRNTEPDNLKSLPKF